MKTRTVGALLLGGVVAAAACSAFSGADALIPVGAGGGGGAAGGTGGGVAAEAAAGATTSAGGPSTGATGSGTGTGTGTGQGGGLPTCPPGGTPDCSNPACKHVECAPAPPVGWSLPGAYYTGPAGSPLASCDDPFSSAGPSGNTGLTVPADTCSACSCQPMCGAATTVDYYQDAACQILGFSTPYPTDGTCDANIEQFAAIGGGPIPGSSCTVAGGAATAPPVTWANASRLCLPQSPGVGCQGSDLCVPKPAAPFAPTTCVAQAGDLPCPAGYPQQFVIYGSTNDTRACDPCTCTYDCSATVNFYFDQACGFPIGSSAGACFVTPEFPIGSLSGNTTTATCQSAGGGPVGSATESDPTTVCCR